MWQIRMRRLACLALVAAAMSGAAQVSAFAQTHSPSQSPSREKKTFTDPQIVEGFLKTSFGAEFQLAGRVDRIRKYQRPVRIFVDSRAKPDRTRQLADVIADIGARIQHLDIAQIEDRDKANLVVTLVRDKDFQTTLASIYGEERASEIKKSLDPQCLSGFTKNELFEIEHAEVLLTADTSDFIFRDCAYEELLQALGPINDTSSVPWTMFNDAVQTGYFDVYDQYILNILYDPRIKAGMTMAEAKAVLPDVLLSVRAWVKQVNGLGP